LSLHPFRPSIGVPALDGKGSPRTRSAPIKAPRARADEVLMRDVLYVVMIIGGLGMMFVMALAATKYGEASNKDLERRARARARDRGEDTSESSTGSARPAWEQEVERQKKVGVIFVLSSLVSGFVLGSVVANTLGIHGVARALVVSGGAAVMFSCLGASFLLIRHLWGHD
jgi:hypothetical protein